MKTTGDITLYDLMAEDMDVWLSVNKPFGLTLEIENEDGQEVVNEVVHPYAAEGLADFCRRYLKAYEMASKLDAA